MSDEMLKGLIDVPQLEAALLLEAGYCLQDLLSDAVRDLFSPDPKSDADDGFDFDRIADS